MKTRKKMKTMRRRTAARKKMVGKRLRKRVVIKRSQSKRAATNR